MNESEKVKRVDDLNRLLIQLINNMREVSDGLYRHTYDIDTELPQINKTVISTIEKTVNSLKEDLFVSEEVVSYLETKDGDANVLLEYLDDKEHEIMKLKNKAQGKSKYFKMLYNGIMK
ncbi:hypothetical protein NEPAR06_0427 [Nematocida parisii]|uniref:Uncharacterized protein n=1 Tax=Nematocida parisii (strain ERTm3) TaxID=935791 RepID=I3EIE1_NEMP3|nr:uncharacterized protein NEPG_01799 [Nematocida parisii ERTm1]EIJ88988.1 hypothetical protein NEQG_00807 [Nematocida parisii ERTm3]KAI5126535.1 hypothetical protein NEPAR03_0533 [Nematocida parisii]EIJ93457.1 hypothetical protein NEPG_01799 [Nematocida parisii ERTm1]KAI5128285.1 hypothetical protein NEPAR08_1149 [Nematocida parisii]KAI5140064.1 hypothetical protein NEPAR04_0038 [Nematocida parisii]|eukprot:XP_013059627.1 hypothetical protein NEPG_01799 [Nematocida parisii ERTm1]